MSDLQIRISESGDLESEPLTWDGEPMFSPDTIREGLFSLDAFTQLAGQISMDVDGGEDV